MDEEIRAELLDRIKRVYDVFSTKRVYEIIDVFRREFGEEQVDYTLKLPDWTTFTRNFSSQFALYNSPSGGFKLCSTTHAELLHLDLLYHIDEQEAWEEIPMAEAFDTLLEDDVFSVMTSVSEISTILVHFPVVKVSNERGQFTIIKDFFAKIWVKNDGKMPKRLSNGTWANGFVLNRAHYTYAHFVHNYMHSHVSDIPVGDFSEFQDCCKGTGPVNQTIEHLKSDNFVYTENEWIQFCWDLAKYVTVESEEGRPYNYLKKCDSPYIKGDKISIDGLNVSLRGNIAKVVTFKNFPELFWNKFLKYLVINKIPKFRWANKQWEIAEYPMDYLTTISNAFLEYCKENMEALLDEDLSVANLLREKVLIKAIVDISGVYSYLGEAPDMQIENSRGQYVCTFKGVNYNVVIEDKPDTESAKIQVLLHPKIVAFLTGCLLKVLNTEYGKRDENIPAEPEIPFDNF